MSLHESADVESIGTTETDDTPTLEPTMTMAVTHVTANGADGELLGYAEFSACVTLATDTIARVATEADSR